MEVEDRSTDTEICTVKGVGPSALVIELSISSIREHHYGILLLALLFDQKRVQTDTQAAVNLDMKVLR